MLRLLFFVLLTFVCTHTFAQDQLSQNRVERLYQRGVDLINHYNYGSAREIFSEFLIYASPVDTRRGEAEYYVAFSALNLGHADSEKLVDQFIINNPSSPKASTAYFDLANYFYGQGNYAKSASYYKRADYAALTADQQNEGHFKWGYSLFTQKKLDDALEQFNFVKAQRTPYSPAASYYAGYVESVKEMYDEAIADLKRAEASPSYANIVPYQIAYVYYKQKQYDQVITYANSLKGRKDVNSQHEISMLVAEAYYYKGDFKNAVDAYQRYFEKSQKAESGLLFRAGYANYSTGNVEKGIEYLDRAAAGKDTVSYYASYYLGILHLKQGNKPLALNAFDYARKNPVDKSMAEEGSFQYGKVAYDNGKPDLAIAELEKFTKTYPMSPRTNEVKELLAQAYVNGNNFNKAIEYIETLPTRNQYINQAYQKATYLKGSEAFNKEQYSEASVYFEKSLMYPIDPNYTALASFWNAEAHSISRRYDVAITNYQKVVGLLPNVEADLLTRTRYGLGYAYYNTKAYDKALFNFKDFTNRTTASNPNYSDGLIRLADCYYVSRQYTDALTAYNKAKAANSADADYVLLQAGIISGIMKKYTDAKSRLSELISRYPNSQYRDEAIYKRAEFDIEQSDYASAVEGLSQLIREGNSAYLPVAHMRRGMSHYNLKQYDRSVVDYQSIIRQFPTHPVAKDALPLLQEALNLTNRSDEFAEYLAIVEKANPDSKGFESLEYEAAKNLYFNQQYSKAITSLSAFMKKYPQSPVGREAKYYLAESYYRNNQLNEALPIYNELGAEAANTNGSKVVARSADIYLRNKDYKNAAVNYGRLEKLATNKKEQFNAWLGLMESHFQLSQYDSSDLYAKTIIEKGSATAGGLNKATLYLGKSALARGDMETAKDEFLNTLNTAQDESGAEAKYLLATIFFSQKEHKQCYETLISLNHDFAAYEEWVGKSFLLLSDNFVATGDVFNARHTLQSLIDKFPRENVKEEARAKLKKLEADELDKSTKVELDSIDVGN
jgi:TolA-binding protein